MMQSLPKELILIIFDLTEIQDLINISVTCKLAYDLVNEKITNAITRNDKTFLLDFTLFVFNNNLENLFYKFDLVKNIELCVKRFPGKCHNINMITHVHNSKPELKYNILENLYFDYYDIDKSLIKKVLDFYLQFRYWDVASGDDSVGRYDMYIHYHKSRQPTLTSNIRGQCIGESDEDDDEYEYKEKWEDTSELCIFMNDNGTNKSLVKKRFINYKYIWELDLAKITSYFDSINDFECFTWIIYAFDKKFNTKGIETITKLVECFQHFDYVTISIEFIRRLITECNYPILLTDFINICSNRCYKNFYPIESVDIEYIFDHEYDKIDNTVIKKILVNSRTCQSLYAPIVKNYQKHNIKMLDYFDFFYGADIVRSIDFILENECTKFSAELILKSMLSGKSYNNLTFLFSVILNKIKSGYILRVIDYIEFYHSDDIASVTSYILDHEIVHSLDYIVNTLKINNANQIIYKCLYDTLSKKNQHIVLNKVLTSTNITIDYFFIEVAKKTT